MRLLYALSLTLAPGLCWAQAEITPAEIEAWAKTVQEGLAQGDAAAFDGVFDTPGFVKTVLAKVEASPAMKKGMGEGIGGSFAMGPQLKQAIEAGGSYVFLRAVSDPPRARFRLVLGEEGFNYHDLRMVKTNGTLKARDIYVYTNGEWLSAGMGRLLQSQAQTGDPKVFQANARKLQTARELLQAGDFAGAKAALAGLPPEFDTQPSVGVLRVQIAVNLSDEDLVRATRDFEAKHPGSPALPFVLIDQFLVQERWEELFAQLDTLDEAVGGDPYLDVMRGHSQFAKGDYAKSEARFRRAAKRERTLTDAHFALIDIGLVTKNWALVVEKLTLLEAEFGVEWGDLTEVDGFQEFVQSADYKAWISKR